MILPAVDTALHLPFRSPRRRRTADFGGCLEPLTSSCTLQKIMDSLRTTRISPHRQPNTPSSANLDSSPARNTRLVSFLAPFRKSSLTYPYTTAVVVRPLIRSGTSLNKL